MKVRKNTLTLSYTINPNFLPNYDEEIDKKNLLKNGVIYARYETGIISQLSEEDINHNKFTSMTGLILTDEEAFCLAILDSGIKLANKWRNDAIP